MELCQLSSFSEIQSKRGGSNKNKQQQREATKLQFIKVRSRIELGRFGGRFVLLLLLLLFCWSKVFFSFRQKTSNYKSNLRLLEDASSARVSLSTVDKTTWSHPLIDFPVPSYPHTHTHVYGIESSFCFSDVSLAEPCTMSSFKALQGPQTSRRLFLSKLDTGCHLPLPPSSMLVLPLFYLFKLFPS